MPAFVLAPPLPPVGRVCVSAREDALEVSSENTTIAFPLGLFVLVITSGRCPLWPAAAMAPAIVRHVAVRQARKFSLGSFCISIGISWEFSVKSRPAPRNLHRSRDPVRFTEGYSLRLQEKLRCLWAASPAVNCC